MEKELFASALGLDDRWEITEIRFETEGGVFDRGQMDIFISWKRGSLFEDESGQFCKVHDTVEKKYRHIDFFQHECYIHCSIPRIRTSDGLVHTVKVPWARPGSRFTLQFESYAMTLLKSEMPVNRAAKIMGVYPNVIWRILDFYVSNARSCQDHSNIEQLGIDDKSYLKGHKYLTVCSDLEERKVIYVSPGRAKTNIKEIRDYIESCGVSIDQIKDVCIDLYPSYIGGVLENFEHASITFDKFHIIKLLNQSIDRIRIAEQRESKELKKTKFLWLKKSTALTEKQSYKIHYLSINYPTIGLAYRLKMSFNDLWSCATIEEAEEFLNNWTAEVNKTTLHHLKDFVNTIYTHWYGIVMYFKSRITNGIVEGINQKIALAIRRARGFKNLVNLSNMIYLIAGKLDFKFH